MEFGYNFLWIAIIAGVYLLCAVLVDVEVVECRLQLVGMRFVALIVIVPEGLVVVYARRLVLVIILILVVTSSPFHLLQLSFNII
jgi:hypothetical protein